MNFRLTMDDLEERLPSLLEGALSLSPHTKGCRR